MAAGRWSRRSRPRPTPSTSTSGPGPDGAPLVVYARAGDIFQYDPATGREQPLAEVNTPGVERNPSIHRSALGFVREVHHRPVVYLRRGGNTRRQPRPRFKRRLGVDGVELSARGLFVVYRTDIVPTCCSRATLYRVVGGRLRHVFAVGGGGANFGQIVSPTVFGRNVYFGRTTTAPARATASSATTCARASCFSARGTSRALSLTWRGDSFLMSRDSNGCQGAPDGDPTAMKSCELVLTDPIRFTRASRADVRRTRP